MSSAFARGWSCAIAAALCGQFVRDGRPAYAVVMAACAIYWLRVERKA